MHHRCKFGEIPQAVYKIQKLGDARTDSPKHNASNAILTDQRESDT